MNSYVYFMANNHNTVLYVGVTNNLERRVWEHKNKVNKKSFTYKCNCHKLVYYEVFANIEYAIVREKQLKNWKREWKNELINKQNPEWLKRLEFLKESYPVFSDNDPKTLPNEIIYTASCLFDDNDVITGDVGQNQMWTSQSVFLRDNMRLLNSGGLGSMGFSLPASIGACYAKPDSRVLCISGDGGILMNIQELGTVSRENLPIKILIMNNQSLGLISPHCSVYQRSY